MEKGLIGGEEIVLENKKNEIEAINQPRIGWELYGSVLEED